MQDINQTLMLSFKYFFKYLNVVNTHTLFRVFNLHFILL